MHVPVVGDVDYHGYLLTVTGDDLRPLGMRGAQQLAEALLGVLDLPPHRVSIQSGLTRQNDTPPAHVPGPAGIQGSLLSGTFWSRVEVIKIRAGAAGGAGACRPAHPAGHVNLIIRYHWRMRTITATEASRNFSDLLDAIERGETVTITRGHHVVAEMRPARRRTGADLRTALDDIPPPDERFAADIAGAVALLTSEGTDPWAGA